MGSRHHGCAAKRHAELGILSVKTIEVARKLPLGKLIAVNAFQVYYSPRASFTYDPVVDGSFVPDFAWRLLLESKFDHDVNVMTGHNSNEGLLFTSPNNRQSDVLKMGCSLKRLSRLTPLRTLRTFYILQFTMDCRDIQI